MAWPRPLIWSVAAFGTAFLLATLVLCLAGTGKSGVDAALASTGRLSLLLFWPAYTGSAIVALFGQRFRPVQRNGREFGLAFASAHLVHLGLVGWLCAIGAVPGAGTFVLFGLAAFSLYLLAALSIDPVRECLNPRDWRLLRLVTMTYIAYAFAVDFLYHPFTGGIKHVLAYLPFAALSIAGPLLRLAAFLLRARPQMAS